MRHRYVHGGFKGTDARFAIRFPPAERYEGRFFHSIFAVPGSEHMFALPGWVLLSGLGGSVGFAVATGVYLVESNQGSLNGFSNEDWTVTGYRTSAAAASHSRALAAQMYGEHRPYGYVFGGSGGAYKTMSSFENASRAVGRSCPVHPRYAYERAEHVHGAVSRHPAVARQVPGVSSTRSSPVAAGTCLPG